MDHYPDQDKILLNESSCSYSAKIGDIMRRQLRWQTDETKQKATEALYKFFLLAYFV